MTTTNQQETNIESINSNNQIEVSTERRSFHETSVSNRPSSASGIAELYPNRRSINNQDEEEDEEGGEEEEEGSEIIFGSEPIGVIGKTQPRAVIRIERDYSARGATTGRVRFWDGWIDELDGRITPLQLQNTLNDLNSILASAYDPYKSILDNTLSILTLYLSPLIIDSHYKKQMSLFGKTIEEYNRTIYNPVGLNLLHPRRLEIEYY